MSDRVAVMNGGRIEQVGTPDALYDRPRTRFVADFLGVRNILAGTVRGREEGRLLIETTGGLRLTAPDGDGSTIGAPAWVGFRAERLSLVSGPTPGAMEGTIEDELYLGDRTDWRVRVGGETLTVAEGAAQVRPRQRGDRVLVAIPPAAVLRLEES
jgi:ABC-type Fe3+/spermidine/putrescine transport system ATPase subunit